MTAAWWRDLSAAWTMRLDSRGRSRRPSGFPAVNAAPDDQHTLTDAQCTPANYGATRLVIPAPDTENDDHNPPRIAPRHVFDIALGTDNLFKRERFRTTLKFAVTNVTNKDALYNFLSTFSGTHFIHTRAYQTAIGIGVSKKQSQTDRNRGRRI